MRRLESCRRLTKLTFSRFDDEVAEFDLWRLCDQLNIIQAALLVAGHDPSSTQEFVEGWDADKRPTGYEAAKAAISRALVSQSIKGQLYEELEYDMNGNPAGPIEGSIDLKLSVVEVSDLKVWLADRGMTTGFFFPKREDGAEFLDPDHDRYSQKLAATISAWRAMDSGGMLKGKTPKQSLEKWLRLNADRFGLCDEDGKPNEKGIEECAKVANWKHKGGAPKTPD